MIKNREDYEGSIMKCECIIKNERGMFKERMSMQSKDNVMEQVAYEIAHLLGIKCCKASCRKVNGVLGSFSRFEVIDMNNVIPYSEIMHTTDLHAEDLFSRTLQLTKGNPNNFVTELYGYIIFDYIMGQMDRHLENLSVYKKETNYVWYPLYDNGLCCFATYSNENVIESLQKGFYSSRIGASDEILEALSKYRNIIYKGDLNNLVRYKKLNTEVINNIIIKADKYKQVTKNRRMETANFIMRQAHKIHDLNYGRI